VAASPDVIVIGAGPAGLMAGIQAAACGARATVLEASPVAGRKLLLTGGGRCNLTHAGGPAEIVEALGPKGRFLRHALHEVPPAKVMEFFGRLGLSTRTEPSGDVFPVTNRAADVRDALVREAAAKGAKILYGRKAMGILSKPPGFSVRVNEQEISGDCVILASGGLSYPATGSTGEGLGFASALGHRIVEPRPALVPLVAQERWPGALSGIAMERVVVSCRCGGRRISLAGSMIFTQNGIGGPVVLDLSRHLTDLLPSVGAPIEVHLDLAASLTAQEVEQQILRWSQVSPKRGVQHLLGDWLPKRLAAVLADQAACPGDLQACQLTKEARKRLVLVLKSLALHVEATRPMPEATVTRGGIDTSQVDPKTLESRVCKGLFFAGEVLDVDGPCGGYNLQICWSTGALAGRSAACGR
jgi:predicted Rossmann fold flavoprotein